MKIEVKEKVIQNESVFIKTDKLQLNLAERDIISASTENGMSATQPYINSNFEFYDNDLGLISLSIDSKGVEQCKNHSDLVNAVRKLYSRVI